jgi:hypothetical protein
MGFLDKGGSVKDSLGGAQNQALRTVRAKRELEEAGMIVFHHCPTYSPLLNRQGLPQRRTLA